MISATKLTLVGALLSLLLVNPALARDTKSLAVVPAAQGVEHVSAVKMGCKKPWVLRDCSGMMGPKKKLRINGVKVKVAGTEDGKTTVMFGGNFGKTSNTGYEQMRRILEQRDIELLKVTPISSGKTVFGYALETAEDNYHIWDEFKR